MTLPVALDAMGGDKAPGEIVAGAVEASKEHGIPVVLVGRPEELEAFDTGGLEILAASEVIGMGDDGARSVRVKKDSSLVRAAEAVRDGKASAMVSAGNTGATAASALLRMGRLPGVSRPAVATPIPVPGSTPTVLLDAGANAECQPAWLAQFARMGAAVATARWAIQAPKVGLLSIGEEAAKGTSLTKEVFALLSADQTIDFIGNVEGRDILSDRVDVIVTDGFTGNVALKTLEGALRFMASQVFSALTDTPDAARISGPLLELLVPLADALDPETTGGAMLLGVDGVCVIGHGSSSRRAIVNALRVGHEMAVAGMPARIAAAVDAGSGDKP
ncbi:MAG TPA: phosphate acyltransferase PlsX [Acidimicrobiales bacterium]|nr:phosphate acyltransferase PlsX [Acidimicrobiales bacterium]